MQSKFTYLLVDFFCILFPFIFSFHPKLAFYKKWKYFLWPCLLTAAFFILWDILFTRIGVWRFNPSYVTGYYFFNLPIEEVLFFICIPYACVFTYDCIGRLYDLKVFNQKALVFSWLLSAVLLLAGFMNLPKLYTSASFLLLALLLLILSAKKKHYLAGFFICFLIILIPFFISNGILTGSFIAAPVVSYNNDYNLGIRLFTIPLEDVFYGMLLLLLNVAGFEMAQLQISEKK